MLVVLAVMLAAAVLFLKEWLPVDLVAVLVLLVLAISGVVGYQQALAGFSNPAVITVAAVLVLGSGLMRTGVAHIVGQYVLRLAGGSETRLLVVTMLTVGLLSGVMNNIGVAAMLLPVVLGMAKSLDQPPAKLLMPLAFASLLGGLITLIGTAPNILISGALTDAGHAPFGLFQFAPIGLTAVALGTAYMALVGRHLLPSRDLSKETEEPVKDLQATYGLTKRLCAMSVPEGSALSGKTLADSRLGSALGLNVVAITRDGHTTLAPGADALVLSGDNLLVEGRLNQLNAMRGWRHLVLDGSEWTAERLANIDIELTEVTVRRESGLVGSSLREFRFRRRYGLNVVALLRDDRVQLANLALEPLRPGDRLLVQGVEGKLARLRDDSGFRDFRRLSGADAARQYHLHERVMSVRVPVGSILAGKMLAESRLGNAFDLTVLGRLPDGTRYLDTDVGQEFHVGDTLLVQGLPQDLITVQGLDELQVERDAAVPVEMVSRTVNLTEFTLSPTSRHQAKTLEEMKFRERYGLSVVAIWSEGHAYRSRLRDRKVRLGDVLLLHGPDEKLRLLRQDADFMALGGDAIDVVEPGKAPLGAGIMGAVILTVIMGWLPIYIAAPAGAALMVITGCLTMDIAYRTIEWKAVVLIAGMLSLGVAMQETGTADVLADSLLAAVGWLGPYAVLSAVFWFTALAAQVMPTAAVAVLMAPIALDAAATQGISPHALLMVVAIGSSSAFLSPVGHPVNLMVMGMGGYRFSDYTRVGLGLVVINFLIALLLLPLLFPLIA